MSIDKAGYFTFLLYSESTPKDREMELELVDIPVATSPLHDKDKSNTKGQGYKKAHYHVIYVVASPVTAHSVHKRIQKALGNKSIAKVQIVKQSMENMYSYLTHESKSAIAKNKYKCAKKDIRLLSNLDIDRYVVLDVKDKEEMLNNVYDMIDNYGLANVRKLGCFVKEHGSDYDLPSMKIINSVLRSHTGLVRLYFDAMYRGRKYGQSYVDTRTGEIKK